MWNPFRNAFFNFCNQHSSILLNPKQLENDAKDVSSSNFMDRWPHHDTIQDAKKLSSQLNKAITMDFWMKSARIGVYENDEKRLLLSDKFYSSKITNIYKTTNETEYLVVSENSIFIVDASIKAVRICDHVSGRE